MRSPGRLQRILLLTLLIGAAGLVVLSAGRSWREALPWTGLEIQDGSAGVAVVAVEPGSPADRAGVLAGDILVEIGGQPISSRLVARDELARAGPGKALGLGLLRQEQLRSTHLFPGALVRWRIERIAGSAVGLMFLLGALAVSLRPRGTPADGVYAVWCLTGAVLLGVSWSWEGGPLDLGLFWADRLARLFFPALWIHLTLLLGFRRERVSRWLPVVYAPSAALLLAELQMVALGGALRSSDPVLAVDTLQSRVEMGWIGLGLICGLVLMVLSSRRTPTLAGRAQARWIIAGATAGLAPFLLLAALPGWLGLNEPEWSWLALPPLAVIPFLFTGAVLEYRLMDLALFARRVMAVAANLGISLILFLGFLTLTRQVLVPVMRPAGIVPVLIAAVITAALAPSVRAGTQDLVNRIYYRRRLGFRRSLERVARDLNAEQDLPRLAEALERRVGEALDAGTVRLLLHRGGGQLVDPVSQLTVADILTPEMSDRLRRGEVITLATVPSAPDTLPGFHTAGVQVLVPLRVEGEPIALLAVGPRLHGRLLDSEDLALLRSVANHAAAAVAGAQHLAELKDQVALVQRLQARTQALIESSPIGMAVVDKEGRIRHWNKAAERLTGRARPEVMSCSYAEVLPEPVASFVGEALRDIQRPERLPANRVRLMQAGQEKLVDLAACELSGGEGSDGVLITLHDVTERMRLEAQLIQQDRLASVGLLAAGVAHEVNTPLTGISSYAQMLLEETEGDDPRRPLLEKIVHQADRASQIARGLLRFSRTGGPGELTLGPVDLGDLVEETAGLLGPQIRRAGATVAIHRQTPVALAFGDRSRLQQVMMNLLLNSLDALSHGGQVAVRTGMGGDGRVFAEVEDNGVGIPEQIQGRIFDPFFTTKKPGRGTGLGLSISYGIVREHGGNLAVDSRPGRGTTMRLFLPAAVAAVRLPAPERADSVAG